MKLEEIREEIKVAKENEKWHNIFLTEDEEKIDFLLSLIDKYKKCLEWTKERCQYKHGYTVEDIEKKVAEALQDT